MPFSASTCITNVGTTPLGPVLSAYTDFDSYLNPFSFVNTNQITGAACPYVFTGIPDGATNIRLIDPTNSCCITIPIQSDNFCDTCDLGFTVLSSQTNSQIIAGDLTGSCQANISNYVINWYGPNSSTNIAFRSGKGNTFSYQFTHPLTGSGFVFAQAGTYTPVIDRVIISGYTFVNTGGTGVYDATLDCFDAVQVNPLTCDNGNTPTSAYTHSYYFSGTGASSIPLNVTFQLSSNTNYFAYSFTGQSVADRLRITYSGGTTPSQLILEDISVGTTLPSSNYVWNQPKTYNGSNYKRVICLTGLTRVPGDSLSIQIIPNAGNTEWALNLRCMSSFTCSPCVEQYLNNNTPYKILASSITAFTSSCFTQLAYKVSGCNFSEISGTNLYNYWQNGLVGSVGHSAFYNTNMISLDSTGQIPRSTISTTNLSSNYLIGSSQQFYNLTRSTLSCQTAFANFDPTAGNFNCSTSTSPGTFSFSKYVSGTSPTVGVIDMTFTNSFWFDFYHNSYLTVMNENSTWGISACTATTSFYPGSNPVNPTQGKFSGGTSKNNIPSFLDPTDFRYYRTFRFCIPTATGSTLCKGNTLENPGTGFAGNSGGGLIQCYNIHPSSLVITGNTGTNYSIRIVMNTIVNGLTFDTCTEPSCLTPITNIINGINNSSTATTNNVTFSSFGSPLPAISPPFNQRNSTWILFDLSGTTSFTATCRTNFRNFNESSLVFYDYQNYLIPLNASNNTPVLQYSAATCPNLPRFNSPINPSGSATFSTLKTFAYYNLLLNEPENGPPIPPFNTAFTQVYRNFEIYALPITNGVVAGGSLYGNNIGALLPNVENPNWVRVYRQRFGVQEVCNSAYVIGC